MKQYQHLNKEERFYKKAWVQVYLLAQTPTRKTRLREQLILIPESIVPCPGLSLLWFYAALFDSPSQRYFTFNRLAEAIDSGS